MVIKSFPDPRTTDETGLVALGGDLEPESLILAYSQGIFPWPVEDLPLPWFCPLKRGILDFKKLHLPRSLIRAKNKKPYRFTIDAAFDSVIKACATIPRIGPDGKPAGTWITEEMIEAYRRLHRLGIAHSCEAWDGDQLVGGLYGVAVKGNFAGESMFHRADNASKLALLHLIDHLSQRGIDWIDIQMVTPHLELLGAQEISRARFLKRLAETQAEDRVLFP